MIEITDEDQERYPYLVEQLVRSQRARAGLAAQLNKAERVGAEYRHQREEFEKKIQLAEYLLDNPQLIEEITWHFKDVPHELVARLLSLAADMAQPLAQAEERARRSKKRVEELRAAEIDRSAEDRKAIAEANAAVRLHEYRERASHAARELQELRDRFGIELDEEETDAE